MSNNMTQRPLRQRCSYHMAILERTSMHKSNYPTLAQQFSKHPTNPIHGLRDWLSCVLVNTTQLSHVLVLVVFTADFGI